MSAFGWRRLSNLNLTITALIDLYACGERTPERRGHLLRVIGDVLDYFVPLEDAPAAVGTKGIVHIPDYGDIMPNSQMGVQDGN